MSGQKKKKNGISSLGGCSSRFYYLVINKLITNKMQNIFLIVEYSDFMKCYLHKLV